MKRLLGCFAIGCLAPVAALVILGLVLPRTWTAESSVWIERPISQIHPYVEDFERWKEWVQWERPGSTDRATLEISGSGEVGSSIRFEGKDIGEGVLTITETDPAAGLTYDTVLQGGTVTGNGSIRYQSLDGGTRVTWRDEGTLPRVIGGLTSWITSAGLTKKFSEDLERLKSIVEQ